MGFLDLSYHLLGFFAPALAVALLVALAARFIVPGRTPNRAWWTQAAINFIVGALVMAAGLWHFGVDGKMASYAALIAAVASCQWACSRGWTS